MKSLFSLALSFLIMLMAVTWYFPRYNQTDGSAVIAWDVSGYYMYLPAVFIYHDVRFLSFEKDIIEKYHPSAEYYQGGVIPDGSPRVLQYTCGMALMYSPFFFIAHFLALLLKYPADGFSFPYQVAISFGSLLYALVGLIFLRKFLLSYFSDMAVAISIFGIALGSNYFEYSTISGALSHNYLFSLYAMLLWYSIKFWERPCLKFSFLTGLTAGLIIIIRPTEIIALIIPVLIGINSSKEFLQRIKFLFRKFLYLVIAALPVLCFVTLQLCYWKYVSGHWFNYSYKDQGFDWLHPHLSEGIYSYQAGWLVYTPIMIFSLAGFLFLYKLKQGFFWFSLLFSLLFIYICFAWHIWSYSGSFGIRAMVQCYAVLAIPLTAFNEWMLQRKWKLILFSSIMFFCVYYNLWLTHQAHKGGLLTNYGMTKEYFWKIFLRYNVPIETRYFLDCSERFDGEPQNIKTIFSIDFESDSLSSNEFIKALNGNHSLFIDKENAYFNTIKLKLPSGNYDWARASFLCGLKWKEYVDWNMTQCWLKFFANGKDVKDSFVRVQHLVGENETKRIHLDIKFPEENCDSLQLFFFKGNSWAPVAIDDLKIEVFNE